jgi:hypothetical protein
MALNQISLRAASLVSGEMDQAWFNFVLIFERLRASK